jgi:hypothetical protein
LMISLQVFRALDPLRGDWSVSTASCRSDIEHSEELIPMRPENGLFDSFQDASRKRITYV